MLDGYALIGTSEPVYRLANAYKRVEALAALGHEPSDVEETLAFLNEASSPDANELIDGVFKLWPGRRSWPEGRFSDGSYPVFYSALEWETAEAEIAHHIPKRFGANLSGNVFYDRLECRLDATAYDLRPARDHFQFLIEEPWPPCQSLGKEARGKQAGALLTQSVRRLEGSNAPVFNRDTLSAPRFVGNIAFICVNGAVTTVAI